MMQNWKIISGIVGAGVVAAGLIVWLVYFKTPTITPDVSQPQFGTGQNSATSNPTPTTPVNEALAVVENTVSNQKIFKISDGPIAGATLIEATRPTSTIARFVLANNGHVFDFEIDTPGAIPKAISNTTIPGIVRVAWSEGGRGALLQYLDVETIKTAHLGLPPTAATTSSTVKIQFLPSGAKSVSVSPDGASVAYLLTTSSGSDGYLARADGANSKKLFSLPFTQLLLSWPSQGTLLAQTLSATGVAGVVFSIDAKTGAASPLLYASGLTAIADRTFSRMVYQTNDATRGTYIQNIRTGLATGISFDPMPENCRFALATSTALYCPASLTYLSPQYPDLWHLGAASSPTAIVRYNTTTGRSTIIAIPGSGDGGLEADIAELSLSQNDDYLLYVRKSDRSLWGVRLKD